MTDIHSFEPLFGSWYLYDLIGRGSSGAVYRAWSDAGGERKWAAIKHIPIEERGDLSVEQQLRLINRELNINEQLRGKPHLLTSEETVFFNREDREGVDIFFRMELMTPLPKWQETHWMGESEAVRLGCEICEALAAMEEYGILHRDVKSSNIFVDRNGSFYLGDFGVAKSIGAQALDMTVTGAMNFMAPEIYHRQRVTLNADLYSLGITLYRIMNGDTAPFLAPGSNPTREEAKAAVQRRMSAKELPAAPGASAGLAAVLARACAYAPEARYQTAEEMRDDLKRLPAFSPRPDAGTADPPPPQPRPSRPRTPKWLWIAISAVAVTACLVLAILLASGGNRRGGDPAPAATGTDGVTASQTAPGPTERPTPSEQPESEPPAPTEESDQQEPDAAGPNGSLTNDPPAEETLYYYRVLLHFLYYDATEQWTEYRRADFVPTDGEPTVFTYSDAFESRDVEFDPSECKLEDYYPSTEYSFDPSTLAGKELAGYKVGRYSIKFPIRERSPNPSTFNMLDAGPTSLEGSTEQNPVTVHLWFVAFESGEHIPLELGGIDVREPRYYFCLHYKFGNQETQDRTLVSGCARLQLFVPASLQYNDVRYDPAYATRQRLKDVQTLTEAGPDAPNTILLAFALPYTPPPPTPEPTPEPEPSKPSSTRINPETPAAEPSPPPELLSPTRINPETPAYEATPMPEAMPEPAPSTGINPWTPPEEQPVPPELSTSHS